MPTAPLLLSLMLLFGIQGPFFPQPVECGLNVSLFVFLHIILNLSSDDVCIAVAAGTVKD